MQISLEEIRKAFEVPAAAGLGAGILKIVQYLTGRRKRHIANEETVTNSAIHLIESLNNDINQLRNEIRKTDTEREECLRNYERLRLELTDFKIALRTLYEHMAHHMRVCDHPEELPEMPKTINQ